MYLNYIEEYGFKNYSFVIDFIWFELFVRGVINGLGCGCE